jgi:hypothetical protein
LKIATTSHYDNWTAIKDRSLATLVVDATTSHYDNWTAINDLSPCNAGG